MVKKLVLHKKWILVFFIFLIHLFLRFYQIDERSGFGYDQVNNAWVAKHIIVDHEFPLLGMVAKGNSGFYIGPLYYYFISVFYFFTNLDPIASGIIAGVTSIFTFFVTFYISKKIFNFNTAIISVLIYTISSYSIQFDRIQWPVNFIAPISFIIFYALYKVILGKSKYLILLALATGFSFHIHFTSIFFPIIILLSLPFFPRNKNLVKYLIIAFILFVIFFIPNVISELNTKGSSSRNLSNYISIYYHGFHLRRVFQLTKDAFIEFESILTFKILKPLGYLLFPLFCLVYFKAQKSKERFKLCYLMGLWFLIPWLVFSVYRGEITNYYFSLTRPIVIIILAFLILKLLEIKSFIPKIAVLLFFILYSFVNFQKFSEQKYPSLNVTKEGVKNVIKGKGVIQFTEGDSKSYLYYLYTRNKK